METKDKQYPCISTSKQWRNCPLKGDIGTGKDGIIIKLCKEVHTLLTCPKEQDIS